MLGSMAALKLSTITIAIACLLACSPADTPIVGGATETWSATETGNTNNSCGDGCACEAGECDAWPPAALPDAPQPEHECAIIQVAGRHHIDSVDGSLGRWGGTERWSVVYDLASTATLAPVSSTLWPCEPEPDVDCCFEVDGNGHMGCFRYESTFDVVVAVAPSCAVGGAAWLDVGNGMVALTD